MNRITTSERSVATDDQQRYWSRLQNFFNNYLTTLGNISLRPSFKWAAKILIVALNWLFLHEPVIF